MLLYLQKSVLDYFYFHTGVKLNFRKLKIERVINLAKMPKLKLIFYVFALFVCCNTNAQNNFAKYSLTTISQDEGLSQGSNYFRHEDKMGFMWITCADAINRYDGSRVKVYNLDKYFKNCPNLQQGYGFAEDAESNIYIGSERGLYIYNRRIDKFTLQKVFNNPDETAMPFAYNNDKVWCFNRYYQLASYNIKTKQVIKEASINLDTLKSIHVYNDASNVFYFRFPKLDNKGNVWLAGKTKIAKYNINSKTVSYPLFSSPLQTFKQIYTTAFDTTHNIFYIGTDVGLVQYNAINSISNIVTQVNNKPIGFVSALAYTNNMLVFNCGAGICVTNSDFKNPVSLTLPTYLQSRQFSIFSFDQIGRLWATDDGKGQKIFSFKEKLFYKIPDDNVKYDFIKYNGVGAIAELPNKDLLFNATWGLKKKNSDLFAYTANRTGIEVFRTVSAGDRKNNCTFLLGFTNSLQPHVIFIDSNNRQKIYIAQKANTGTPQDFAALLNGQYLLSASNGLYWFNPKSNYLVLANNKPSAFKINILSNNRIAVSYLSSSMQLYSCAAGAITTIKEILPGVQSFYIQENSKTKQYWVGTNKGIFLLDADFKEIKHFDANNGLAGTYIYGLLLDDDGNAWASHQHGLSSINASNFHIINYDKSDGLQEWDFNNRAFLKGSDGTLYFGGVNGVNYFKPPLQQNVFYKPEVYIDEVLVSNNSYLPDTSAAEIDKIYSDYRNNNIAISTFIKDLENASNQQIIYRIKQHGNKWNYAGSSEVINLTGLEPGSYNLEIGTYNKFSDKETVQKNIEIFISAPFYKKAWFWIFVTALLTALLFGIINSRRAAKQKRLFAEKQALDDQRQKITADLHDDIGASLSSLQVNSAVANKLIDKDIPKTKEVLEKIETQSKKIAEKISDFIWSMKPGKDEFIGLTGRIKNFANDILGSSNINYEIIADKEMDILFKDVTMRKNVLLVAKEAINNAVKYSKASYIKIQLIKKNNEVIMFSVLDNGVGFKVDEQMGNGIVNMKKRVEELKGTFSIISNKTGTEVKFELAIV
jgi:signal transduction histidine kinase/ligand-binding sensor domain-containing protein